MKRIEWIERETLAAQEVDQCRKDRRAAAKAMSERLQLGTVLVSTWGYDQTNVDAYEVVEKSKSGATVKLRRICCESVGAPDGNSSMSDHVVPMPGRFHPNYPDTETKRVTEFGVSFKYGGCTIYDGQSFYRSWYA